MAVSWSHRLIVDKVINHKEELPSPWWAGSMAGCSSEYSYSYFISMKTTGSACFPGATMQ